MLFQKKNNFCFLDIGSYKTACFLCSIENKSVSILSKSIRKTQGYVKGDIVCYKSLRETILSAIVEAEKNANTTVEKVVVSMPAIKTYKKTAVVEGALMGRQVLKDDIRRLINKSLSQIDSAKKEIIHFLMKMF